MEMTRRQIRSFSAIYMQGASFLQMCFRLEHVFSFNGILIHECRLTHTIASKCEVLLGLEPRPY